MLIPTASPSVPLAASPAAGFPLPHAGPAANASVSLGSWLELWMDDQIEPCRTEATVNGYRNIIRNHLRPALGRVRLADLTPELINGYCQWLSEEKGLVKLACHLGLRRSEGLGLRWRDVDLQTGLPSVRWVRTTVGYRVVEKPPKTAESCRTLSIGALDGLLELLQDLRAQRRQEDLPCGPDDYLVLNPEGVPWHPNVLSADLADFVAEHRLPPSPSTACATRMSSPRQKNMRIFLESVGGTLSKLTDGLS